MCDRSQAWKPPSPECATGRGWHPYREGHLTEALATFDIAVAAERDTYSALLGRGRCQRLLHRYDEAVADFTRAHTVRPDAARPLFERGAISLVIGCYDEALADYQAAAALEPAYPGAASYFAELYLYTGRVDESLAISERASRDEPTNLVHRVNIAHAYLLLGDAERAADAYAAIAEERDPGKGTTGAAIALDDLALMRAAGIEAPKMPSIERLLGGRQSGRSRPEGGSRSPGDASPTLGAAEFRRDLVSGECG